jgi:peptidoglycan hydrolase-like protein with peptidoglycan-binding domain
LARLHLEPGRVTEIQQALIREGYLQGDPNGSWDESTRAAMLHYQTDHGFPTTGLPEAKSLMKLGLGPHPLPPELDTSQARATAPDAEGAPAAEPSEPPASQETTPPEEK